ncbi:MAG TPA: pentapeptide repeat-containing protein [Anaerolineales bacterium]|nr:pentapeptide repeat-containing protein [Anaerolineales bacterium]
MKSSARILLFVFLIGCFLALPAHAVQASSQNDSTPNPAAEAYMLDALRATGFADLESFPSSERIISGEALVSALKDPQVQSQSFIYIANITVMGNVTANDIILPGNIQFDRVEFTDYVDLNSSILHAVTIGESTFLAPLDFSLATIDGNVVMTDNVFESVWFTRSTINGNTDLRNNTFNLDVNFYRTHVTGELLFDGSQFLGTEPLYGSSFPNEFWTTSVEGLASFVNTYFAGEAYFAQSEAYRLDLWGATFDKDANFGGVTVERSAVFSNATFGGLASFEDFSSGNTAKFEGTTFNGEATFENGTIARDVSFKDARFNGLANFDFITVGRFCDFIGTEFNDKFSFYYTSVAWPYFDHVTFNGPVVFEGMQADEDFEVANTSYAYAEEPFAVPVATIGGAVRFTNFSVPAGLLLSRSQFESLSIEAEDKLETEFVDISETDIEHELTIANINIKRFTAAGTTVGKSTNLSNVSITEQLDMRNASIGFLKIDQQPRWPTDPDDFNLRGMTYTDIDIGDQGLTDATFEALVGLVNQSAYSPQAYDALSQFLTDKGHPDWAAEVELNQNRRERREVLTPLSGAWFWSWFLDIFAGYGHRPVFAFGWSALVIAVGAFVFRRREDMLPLDQGDAQLEYNPVWYSFSLFLPYIDLGIASRWEPNPCRKWARNYKYIHMMLGWILAPIALLTFGGIIG